MLRICEIMCAKHSSLPLVLQLHTSYNNSTCGNDLINMEITQYIARLLHQGSVNSNICMIIVL